MEAAQRGPQGFAALPIGPSLGNLHLKRSKAVQTGPQGIAALSAKFIGSMGGDTDCHPSTGLGEPEFGSEIDEWERQIVRAKLLEASSRRLARFDHSLVHPCASFLMGVHDSPSFLAVLPSVLQEVRPRKFTSELDAALLVLLASRPLICQRVLLPLLSKYTDGPVFQTLAKSATTPYVVAPPPPCAYDKHMEPMRSLIAAFVPMTMPTVAWGDREQEALCIELILTVGDREQEALCILLIRAAACHYSRGTAAGIAEQAAYVFPNTSIKFLNDCLLAASPEKRRFLIVGSMDAARTLPHKILWGRLLAQLSHDDLVRNGREQLGPDVTAAVLIRVAAGKLPLSDVLMCGAVTRRSVTQMADTGQLSALPRWLTQGNLVQF
eukprot:gene3231-13254_t